MSHTTSLRTLKIVDIAALEEAVQYLNENGAKLEFLKNARPRMYYERQQELCDFVVKVHGSRYDVGFKKGEDGTYYPIFDAWQGDLRAQIGAPSNVYGENVEEEQMLNISKLIDLYGIHAAKNQLETDGYSYGADIEYVREDDSYVLVVNGGY
jgi:hypothetical protein